jgi:hypothetical protein
MRRNSKDGLRPEVTHSITPFWLNKTKEGVAFTLYILAASPWGSAKTGNRYFLSCAVF